MIPPVRRPSAWLLGAFLFVASPAGAAPQVRQGALAEVRVAVREAPSNSVELTFPKGWETDATVFAVPDPHRIVIDLPRAKTARNAELAPATNSLVSGFRLGRHTDKVRVVIDLPPTASGAFEHRWRGSVLTLTLGSGTLLAKPSAEPTAPPSPAPTTAPSAELAPAPAVALQAKRVPLSTPAAKNTPASSPTPAVATPQPTATTPAPTQTPTTAPTTTPTPRPTADKTIAPSPTETPTPQATPSSTPARATATPTPLPATPTSTPTSASTPAPTPSLAPPPTPPHAASTSQPSSSRVLSGVRFDYAEAARVPLVKLKLSFRSEYKLTRRDQKTFDLEIPNCGVSSEVLALPFFPPHDFVGFTFVQATPTAGGLRIAIGVDRGVRVASVVNENEIWIKALNS